MAYVVELCEAGSAAMERFVRSAPEAREGTVVELRVGGLRPGQPPGRIYVAQVKTVGADGSESPASPPGWSPPLGPSQQQQPETPTQMPPSDRNTVSSSCVDAGDAGATAGVASASTVTAPAVAATTTTVPSATGGTLSADAVPWQPPSFVPASDVPVVQPPLTPAAGELHGSPGQMAAPLVPPMVAATAPPPQQQPSPPAGLSNWAPPPWLWQAEAGAATFGPLGGLAPPPPAGSSPGGRPGSAVGPVLAGAPSVSTAPAAAEPPGVPWGAPGAPPPPPAGPPSTVQPGQRPEGDDEAAGHEECLILD